MPCTCLSSSCRGFRITRKTLGWFWDFVSSGPSLKMVRGQLSLSPAVLILDQWEENPGVRPVEMGAEAMFVGPILHHQYSLPGEISQAKNRSQLSFVRKKNKNKFFIKLFFYWIRSPFHKNKILGQILKIGNFNIGILR